jgi:hypothetical protein
VDRLLFHPDEHPTGRTLEDVLEQLIVEVREKQDRARDAGFTTGARESALVVTNLEQALLWQLRRGQLTGAVDITVHPVGLGAQSDQPTARSFSSSGAQCLAPIMRGETGGMTLLLRCGSCAACRDAASFQTP